MRTRVEHIRDAGQITRHLMPCNPGQAFTRLVRFSIAYARLLLNYHGHLEFVNSILAYLAFFALGFISILYQVQR